MNIIPNIIFLSSLTIAAAFAIKNFSKIRRNILLGKDENMQIDTTRAIKNMILIAFGQKKMFDRPIPAFLHLFIYVGFIVINLELLEITVDGILGTHRFLSFLPLGFYNFIINVFEFLALAVIATCIVFLLRRNVININRFKSPELKGFPLFDANAILGIEIILMVAFLAMNAADQYLQSIHYGHYHSTGQFLVSSKFQNLFTNLNPDFVMFIERASWWIHIIGIFIFLNYLPFSKHLHIMLAFPNTYFANQKVLGKFENMPEVTQEVKSMLNIPVENMSTVEVKRFGAKDVTDLSWKNLLDAYTCTECGRCTSVCPANLTGKKLSPRKIMMDTRDRLTEVGKNIDANKGEFVDDQKSLIDTYITSEELLACTTCNACADACPVNINPVEIIVKLRQYKIMELSQAPSSWNGMFSNLETNFSPWKFSPSDRFNWANSENA